MKLEVVGAKGCDEIGGVKLRSSIRPDPDSERFRLLLAVKHSSASLVAAIAVVDSRSSW